MDEFYAVENLRAEALRFGNEVLRRTPVGAADQELEWVGRNDDFIPLLNAVELRFFNSPDAADRTHARFRELVVSYLDGHFPRSRLHAQVCILFIGHADLFNRFERLRLMNDRRMETRRQIRQWRNDVRDAVIPAIDVVLADCSSAIQRLTTMPVILDSRNLEFIAMACFPEGVDPNNQLHEYVMGNLVTNPTSVSDLVLPTLRERQMVFWRLFHFLTHYFGRVASMHI